MAEKKSKYLIWLETLHREYTDRTNITLFGQQAASIRLLADMFEVRCRFERLLERMMKEVVILEDDDIDYEEWSNAQKWNGKGILLAEEDIQETLGITQENHLAQTYSNRLLDTFGKDITFNIDQFRNMVSSLFILDKTVGNQLMEKAIDNELKQLLSVLQSIIVEKQKSLTDEEYSNRFEKIYDKCINYLTKPMLIKEHNDWLDNIDGECDIEEMCERRASLLLDIFESGFVDELKRKYNRKAEDVFGFGNYEFEKWEGRTDEAIRFFAALTKLCPYENGLIDFSHKDRMGKYIIKHHIAQPVANKFIQKMELIKMVQDEMVKIKKMAKADNGDNGGVSNDAGNIIINGEGTSGDNTKRKGGRPKRTGKTIKKSFIYNVGTDSNIRLQCFYKGLIALGWIRNDTDQRNFLSLFSGKETACRVVWTGDINALVALFKELVTNKGYIKLPDKETVWVMVNARFWDHEGNKEFGNERLGSTHPPIEMKDSIDLLVKIMTPDFPIDKARKMMQSQ